MDSDIDLGLELTARLETLGITLDALEVDASGTLVRDMCLGDTLSGGEGFEETMAAPAGASVLETTMGSSLSVGETIGQGGMGIIRVATQHALRREVVVKSVRSDVDQRKATAHVLEEAWFTGMLEHPNIVPIYDISMRDGAEPMIVMKRIEGESWSNLIGAEGVSDSELSRHLDILRQVANAVHYAHSKGIMHRDLKPDNVMVGPFGEVYVLDWGIALSFADDIEGLPSTGAVRHVAGTPRYMAPEMACGEGAKLGPRTDVYLLGAILYEVLTGQPPHGGDTLPEIMKAAYVSEPPALSEEVVGGFAEIVRRAMARDLDARYPSADAFRCAIEACQQQQNSRALAEHAQESLETLEAWLDESAEEAADHGRQRAYELLSACRFGFNQALSDWPDNEVAKQGLQRALERMVHYELDVGSSRAAAALVAALPFPSPELSELAQVGTAKTQRAAARLKELEADADLSAGVKARSFALGATAVAWLLIGLAMGHLDRSGQWPMGHREMFVLWFLNLLSFLPVAMNPGKYLPQTRVNIVMMQTGIFMVSAYLLLWTYGWVAGWSVELTLVVNFLMGAAAWGLMALVTDRVLFVTTLAFLGAVLLVPVWPWAKFEIMAVVVVLGMGGTGLAWRVRSLHTDEESGG